MHCPHKHTHYAVHCCWLIFSTSRNSNFSRKILEMSGLEPGPAGWEARMLPLGYADPRTETKWVWWHLFKPNSAKNVKWAFLTKRLQRNPLSDPPQLSRRWGEKLEIKSVPHQISKPGSIFNNFTFWNREWGLFQTFCCSCYKAKLCI